MKKGKGNVLIFLLVLILVTQVYILFFSDPMEMVRKSAVEKEILLQRQVKPQPSAPPPGQPLRRTGDTVQEIGSKPRPALVPGVGYGEDQEAPRAPLSAYPRQPGMQMEDTELELSLQQSHNFYRTLIYGILILENERSNSLTPEQAKELKEILESRGKIIDVVPETQSVILSTLSENQLKYIYFQKCRKQGGALPLPPGFVDENAEKLLKIMEKQVKKNESEAAESE